VNWLGVQALLARELIREWRFFGPSILGPALQASLFAAVFRLAAGDHVPNLGGLSFFEFLAPGLILAAVMQRAFQSTAYTIMFDKLEASLSDLIGAPMSAAEVLAGWLISATAISFLIGVTVALAMIFFGLGVPVYPLLALYFALTAILLFAAIGVISAIVSTKWDGLSGKETFMLVPLVFLSGTFFPVDSVPEGIWRTLFQLNPIVYYVDGFRYAVTGTAATDVVTAMIVACAATLTLIAIAHTMLRTGYKLKA
jgi:ABC-2 type transport system permease protein